ncbi:MAG: OmpA/MotB family protein [Bacteriovoracaceae bacterium]
MADETPAEPECPKCEECVPGLPGWMGTFSDLVTLLLTFFVLLLSFAKTESAKYEAALGSIRNAFGGNVLKHGKVIQRGKSPDDSPTMLDSSEPIKPFPIEFLTTEGLLDKHEINRASDEDLKEMKNDLSQFQLSDNAEIEELPEGVKVTIKDKIIFEEGSIGKSDVAIPVFERIVQMMRAKEWKVFVQGHASVNEQSKDGSLGPYELSSLRATGVTRALIKRGVNPERITTVFYGDTRPIKIPGQSEADNQKASRRVEFLLRKTDLMSDGFKVQSR